LSLALGHWYVLPVHSHNTDSGMGRKKRKRKGPFEEEKGEKGKKKGGGQNTHVLAPPIAPLNVPVF